MSDDLDYFLTRSEREAVQAIASSSATAAAVHQELCLLYVARALGEMLARRAR